MNYSLRPRLKAALGIRSCHNTPLLRLYELAVFGNLLIYLVYSFLNLLYVAVPLDVTSFMHMNNIVNP